MGAKLRPADGLLVRDVDGEILVLDGAADRIHQLNATASEIWRLLDRGLDVPEIAKALANEFDIDNSKATADVLEALTRFLELNLVRRIDASPIDGDG